MAALLLLAFLWIPSAAGGPVSTVELGTDDATLPYYSSNSEVMTYWQRVLPNNTPMPSAIVEHLNTCADNEKLFDEKLTFQWTPQIKGDDGRVTFHWGAHSENGGKVTSGWGPNTNDPNKEINFQQETEMKGNDEKITFGWGQKNEHDVDHKITFNWGSYHNKRDDEKITFGWGSKTKSDDQKVIGPLGSHASDNDHKITFNWGSSHKEGNDKKITFGWGPKIENDEQKITYQWGPKMDGGIEKVANILGTHANGDDGKITLRWRPNNQNIASLQDGSYLRDGHRHQAHGTGHNHGQFNLENILFQEATLTPGTLIAPYIEPSVFPAPFLRHEIADSIPMTTNNFAHILSMFAPMSHTMAGKIWTTLHTCEHPHPLEGEQQACATSIESMVELAASVLGARDLRAFSSSSDVPIQGFIPSPSSKYKVAAVRAVTSPGEKATTMTCHGMTFPYAVFYCHAVNPTRVYEVTLHMCTVEDGAAATEMQVLAVCHLDTSQFDPVNPFFVARGLKPGDTAVCHFLSRDSILWAPASSTQGQGQVAAQ